MCVCVRVYESVCLDKTKTKMAQNRIFIETLNGRALHKIESLILKTNQNKNRNNIQHNLLDANFII